MHNNAFIFRSFSVFFNYNPLKLTTLFFIILFLGFCQGLTIVMLIPMLSLLDPVATTSSNHWADFLHTLLNRVGIEANLVTILVIFLCSFLSIAVLNYFQTILQTIYQQEFSCHIRQRLFKKVITSDWSFLNGKSKHNHIQVLTTEIPKMTNYYYFYLGLTTKAIIIIAHVCLAMMLSVKFTVFVVGVGMTVFLLLRNYLKKNIVLGGANIHVFRKMLKHIDDFWVTVKMAKVHNSEAFYFNKFDESNKQILSYQYKQTRNRAFPQFLFTLAGVLSLVVMIYFAFQVAHLALASLFVLILLFARIFPQFLGINSDLNMMVSNMESVRMVLDMDNEIPEREFAEKKPSGEIQLRHQLEMKCIHFNYDVEAPLFSDFSATIPAYKITGIIGKSGGGKTTLIDIIAGLQYVQKGEIIVDGIKLTKDMLPLWKSELGYLPQESFFVDGTLRENLIWDSGKTLSDEQIMEKLKLVNAESLVNRNEHGLNTHIVNYNFHFSGGERQRLALARVLIREPKILLLDEATSALDSTSETQIMECLTRLKNNVTIVVVTHRLQLKVYFDHVIDMDNSNSTIVPLTSKMKIIHCN